MSPPVTKETTLHELQLQMQQLQVEHLGLTETGGRYVARVVLRNVAGDVRETGYTPWEAISLALRKAAR